MSGIDCRCPQCGREFYAFVTSTLELPTPCEMVCRECEVLEPQTFQLIDEPHVRSYFLINENGHELGVRRLSQFAKDRWAIESVDFRLNHEGRWELSSRGDMDDEFRKRTVWTLDAAIHRLRDGVETPPIRGFDSDKPKLA